MGTPYRRITHPAGIDIRASEIPAEDFAGIDYFVDEVDAIEVDGYIDEERNKTFLDRSDTIFDRIPFATGNVITYLDAILEALRQGHLGWRHEYLPMAWTNHDPILNQDKIYFEHYENLKKRAITDLDSDSIVQLNHVFPGWIYEQHTILRRIYEQTRQAVQAKSAAKRKEAQEWLSAVCVPNTSTGRKRLPFLSRREMYLLFRIYFDVCKIRKVHALIKPKYARESPELFAANIRKIFPAMSIDDDTLGKIAGYPSKKHIKQPPAINVAAQMLGRAIGYEEHAIRKLIPTHLPDWAKHQGPIRRLARETAIELTRKN